MADSITLSLLGDGSLKGKIQATLAGLNSNQHYSLLLKGARIVSEEVKRQTPVGPTENLKRSVYVKGYRNSRQPAHVVFVSLNRKIGRHAWLVTHGTVERFHGSGKSVGAMPENSFFESAVKMARTSASSLIERETKNIVQKSWEKR